MSSLGNWFEQEIEEGNSFDEIPEGTYKVVIDEAEARESKAGHVYLNLKLIVTEGQFEGRVVFDGLHINHPTVGAMARGKLKKLCELHGIDATKAEPSMFNFESTKKFLKLKRKAGKKADSFFNDIVGEWKAGDKSEAAAPAAQAAEPKQESSAPSWAQ